jgi:hypothetical protein
MLPPARWQAPAPVDHCQSAFRITPRIGDPRKGDLAALSIGRLWNILEFSIPLS